MSDQLANKGYQINFLAGSGGTAKVYCVKELKSGKNYACKITSCNVLADEEELLHRLSNPLFPVWKDYWREEEKGFLLMEYISGCRLDRLLTRRGRFTERETIRIGMELANGLLELHEMVPSYCYRDLKPENIIVQENGRIRLVDLGTVCRINKDAIPNPTNHCQDIGNHISIPLQVNKMLRSPLQRAGTIGFAAPEQWIPGEYPDARSDIYALGRVLYYMLTGIRPDCQGNGNFLPIRCSREKLWRGLEEIILNCTVQERSSRFPSMREVIRCMAQCQKQTKRQRMFRGMDTLKFVCHREIYIYEKNIWKTSKTAENANEQE